MDYFFYLELTYHHKIIIDFYICLILINLIFGKALNGKVF